jgi:hypothetical protein
MLCCNRNASIFLILSDLFVSRNCVFLLFCEQELQCVELIPELRTVSSMCCMNLICSFFEDVHLKIVLLFIKMFLLFLVIDHHVSYIPTMIFLIP